MVRAGLRFRAVGGLLSRGYGKKIAARIKLDRKRQRPDALTSGLSMARPEGFEPPAF